MGRESNNYIRNIINIILILLQLAIFGFVFIRILDYAYQVIWVIQVLAILLVLSIVYKRNITSFKISWIIFILTLPVLGIILYLLWGNKHITRKNRETWEKNNENTINQLKQNRELYTSINNPGFIKEINLINHLTGLPVWTNTKSTYLKLGEIMHEEHLKLINSAKKYIFTEYFIMARGKMYDEMMGALIKKAHEGLEVRMMVDEMGSFGVLPKDFYKVCSENGITVIPFNPLSRSIYKFISFRDHRKITIADGNRAIVGGINIGDEYINAIVKHGHWKDMAVKLEGDAVNSLVALYLNMWDNLSGQPSVLERYRGESLNIETDDLVMPFGDGPMNEKNPAENMYMSLFANAKEYIYISTPYLILNSDMINCIQMAARAGVDVRIMTPGIADKAIVHKTTRSFYGDLLAEGVKIYEYTPGFLHGKVLVSDDEVCMIGSINMDYRSLTWNYESAAWINSPSTVSDVKQDFFSIMDECKEIKLEDWENSSFFTHLGQAMLRIVAPLM
ncbi:cardiolipin synthase [Eubacteriaceae bacterium ES3]|nr:cardiolipin synthase [Eubacteriaceae bacterium ES3]